MSIRNDPSAPQTPVEVLKHFATVSLTAAAAGDYSANDVVSNSATADAGVANELAVGGRGELIKINEVVARCSEDSVVWRLRLHFYNYDPAAADVEMDDNAAKDLAKTATGRDGYLGYLDLPAMADGGTAMAYAQAVQVDKRFACLTSSGSLYFVVETLDAETNETASMTIDFDFYWE